MKLIIKLLLTSALLLGTTFNAQSDDCIVIIGGETFTFCNIKRKVCSCGCIEYLCDTGGLYCSVSSQQSCSMCCSEQ